MLETINNADAEHKQFSSFQLLFYDIVNHPFMCLVLHFAKRLAQDNEFSRKMGKGIFCTQKLF